jgi:hypothetical protein
MKDERLMNPQKQISGNREKENDAYRPAKRIWQSPELTEADYIATELGPQGANPDMDGWS